MGKADPYGGAVGRFYSFYIARPRWARVVGRMLWASDLTPLYRSMEQLRQVAAGSTVLDAACGAGLALRWLPGAGVQYIGVDISPAMVERTRSEARRLRLRDAEVVLGDIEALPFPDAGADVLLLYNALHCVPRPRCALAEAVRCLKPGGLLVGSMLVRGAVPRVDRLLDRDQGSRMMGPGGTAQDLEKWLQHHLMDVQLDLNGAFVVFEGVVPR